MRESVSSIKIDFENDGLFLLFYSSGFWLQRVVSCHMPCLSSPFACVRLSPSHTQLVSEAFLTLQGIWPASSPLFPFVLYVSEGWACSPQAGEQTKETYSSDENPVSSHKGRLCPCRFQWNNIWNVKQFSL